MAGVDVRYFSRGPHIELRREWIVLCARSGRAFRLTEDIRFIDIGNDVPYDLKSMPERVFFMYRGKGATVFKNDEEYHWFKDLQEQSLEYQRQRGSMRAIPMPPGYDRQYDQRRHEEDMRRRYTQQQTEMLRKQMYNFPFGGLRVEDPTSSTIPYIDKMVQGALDESEKEVILYRRNTKIPLPEEVIEFGDINVSMAKKNKVVILKVD